MDAELLRLQISHLDFESARDFIDVARKHEESSREYEALMLAAIICYARPFSNNELRTPEPPTVASSVSFSPDAVLEKQADLELHHKLIRLRNKAIAHAESVYYPTQIISIDPPGAAGIVFSARRWHVLDERIDLDEFRRIAVGMRQQCGHQILDLIRCPRATDP
jgi:hypothetical protein